MVRTLLVGLGFAVKQSGDGTMAKGLYRDSDGWVMVDYGTNRAPIPRDRYDEQGYAPPYDALPTQEQYEASQAQGGTG